tara:strand:- start:2159 stop:2845 length:687 start_codon:yes stop_codon:yes gene_type:complete
MDDIKETTQKLSKGGFLQHVFNFDEDTKKYLINTTQYITLSLGPIIILNKLLDDLLTDFDDTKGNVELLIEILGQITALITGAFFIHRLITYIPTYTGTGYENINLFSIIISLGLCIYNSKSSLGLKMQLLGERFGELWNGKEEKKIKKSKIKDTLITTSLTQPQPTHQASRSDYTLSHDQMSKPVQQQPTNQVGQNDSYGGNGQINEGTGFLNAEPMAANGVLGSVW